MFKDNFMFGAVMVNEEICRDFLEMAVGFPIEKVEISREKSMIYHPEYRGIRLDIIAKDENRTQCRNAGGKKVFFGEKGQILSQPDGHGAAAYRGGL